MKKYKRIFILTDSLGCPRREINIEKTWTNKLLKKWAGDKNIFFTFCRPGLQSNSIDIDYLKEYEPDILICQFGIVDACRRALAPREIRIINRIPFMRDCIKKVIKNNHYWITKKRELHYTSLINFKDIIMRIISSMDKTNIFFLEIAPPGVFLLNTTYGVADDVKHYNHVFMEMENENVHFVNLYGNSSGYLLDDGHHLNEFGNELVFRKVSQILDDYAI